MCVECEGRAGLGLDMSPHECGGDKQGRGSLRARFAQVSAASREVCAWHRVWRLPPLGENGETELPRECLGVLAHKSGERRGWGELALAAAGWGAWGHRGYRALVFFHIFTAHWQSWV